MKIARILLALALSSAFFYALAYGQSRPGPGGGGGTTPGASCGDSSHALGWTGSAFACQGITGSAAAGGSSGQVQYNNSAALAGISGATTDGTTLTLVAPILGTPASGTLTNTTGFPTANLAGAGAGVLSFLATPSSANLAAAVTSETGSGALVFGTSPVLTTPDLGTPSALVLTNATGLPNASVIGLGSAALVATGTSGATIPLLNGKNNWSGQQSASRTTLTISTATFTPTGATNNYKITLTAACTCTIANPSATPVAGTSGVFEIIQDSGGAKTLTWGSQYYATGGSATVQPDTTANSLNLINYYVADATHIYINIGAANATHS